MRAAGIRPRFCSPPGVARFLFPSAPKPRRSVAWKPPATPPPRIPFRLALVSWSSAMAPSKFSGAVTAPAPGRNSFRVSICPRRKTSPPASVSCRRCKSEARNSSKTTSPLSNSSSIDSRGRYGQPFYHAQHVLVSAPLVAYFVHATADQMDAQATDRFLLKRQRGIHFRNLSGIERPAIVLNFNDQVRRAGLQPDENLVFAPVVIGVIHHVGQVLLQRQVRRLDGRGRQVVVLTNEILQRGQQPPLFFRLDLEDDFQDGASPQGSETGYIFSTN